MSRNTPPDGYVVLKAGVIARGAAAAIKDRTDKIAAWRSGLGPKLLAWRQRKGLMAWVQTWRMPRDEAVLVAWYTKMNRWDRPDLEGVDDEPYTPDCALRWASRVKFLDADKDVFVDIDDATALLSWLQP